MKIYAKFAIGAALALATATSAISALSQSAASYHGNWSGTWTSDRGSGSGQVKMLVLPGGANTAYAHISISNAVVPGFSKEIRYQSGSMLVDDNSVMMTFTVTGNQMTVTYRNKGNGDYGRYTLTREH